MSSVEHTKENIKSAFWNLYKEKQIGKITVSEVCKIAGYHRSTFYEYYQDIYDVLEEIESELITEEDFREMIFKNVLLSSPKELIVEQFLSLYVRKGEYLSVLLGEHGDPAFRTKLIARIAPALHQITNCKTKEQEMRLSYLMDYQSSGVLSIIHRWFMDGKQIPVEKMVEIIMSVTVNGLQKEMLKLFDNSKL